MLSEYGLDRDIAIAYIDAAVRRDQDEIADETELPQETVDRYRAAFKSMTMDERSYLIGSMCIEWRREMR